MVAGTGSGGENLANKSAQPLANQDAKADAASVAVVTRDPASGFSQQEQRYTQSYEAFLELPGESTQTPVLSQADDDQLELLIITADDPPIWRRLGVTREQMLSTVQSFRLEVADPRKVWTNSYQPYAQQLYDWIIAPVQQELEEREIGNLTFLADEGMRSVPWAALQNNDQFLIEQYSVGLMPSLSLVDTRFVDVRGAQVLAAGASTFDDQDPLPAVPVELSLLGSLWDGKILAEEEFTLDTLRRQQQQTPFGIVHLATHGEFKPGDPANSYIQLKDNRLQMNQLRQMGWNDPPLELLVLSACRTALGDSEAELGFAGLAIQAGVKSALASLWYVSDVGTLALMTEFYRQLQDAPNATLKAEALRQTQLEILNQNVTFTPAGLMLPGLEEPIPLADELSGTEVGSLLHPYYWAAFTLTGNPW
jgi:CHAT domain-containing protein